jgi:hypothetical protein
MCIILKKEKNMQKYYRVPNTSDSSWEVREICIFSYAEGKWLEERKDE